MTYDLLGGRNFSLEQRNTFSLTVRWNKEVLFS